MAKTLQFRRGTTAELSSVTGAEGELFVDTTKDTVVVMDGSTAGGKPLATESYVGTAISNLVDSAPGALDTLNELAAALGDDANFATSISNTVATAGGYANSAYSQANTATTDAATAGCYANSAYSTANTALIHAQAAFNAANTGGGGGASTGDFTFSANTITLPDFTDGTLNVTGNVGSISSESLAGTGWTLTYFESDNSNGKSLYIMKTTNSSTKPSDAITALLESVTAPTNFTFATYTLNLTSAFTYSMSQMGPDYTHSYGVNLGYTVPGSQVYSSTSTTISSGSITPTEFEYTFSQTGEFISDSALIGDVLISDDIITPIVLDSYGVASSGTLTINGNLEVLGDFSSTGLTPYFDEVLEYNTQTDVQTEVNKKYVVSNQSSVITFLLPSVATMGDTIVIATSSQGTIKPPSGVPLVTVGGTSYNNNSPFEITSMSPYASDFGLFTVVYFGTNGWVLFAAA